MISYKGSPDKPREQGFILFVVIWFVAIVGLAMAYLAQKIEDNLDEAIEYKKIMQKQLDEHNTEQTLFYLLATRERSYSGLEVDRG